MQEHHRCITWSIFNTGLWLGPPINIIMDFQCIIQLRMWIGIRLVMWFICKRLNELLNQSRHIKVPQKALASRIQWSPFNNDLKQATPKTRLEPILMNLKRIKKTIKTLYHLSNHFLSNNSLSFDSIKCHLHNLSNTPCIIYSNLPSTSSPKLLSPNW